MSLAEAIKGAAAVRLRQRTKFVVRMLEQRYGRCWKRNKGDAIGYRLWLSRATMAASIAVKAAQEGTRWAAFGRPSAIHIR
jgi:hypothetical protein